MSTTNEQSLKISVKSFVTSIVIILVLIIIAYLLTLFIPVGSFDHLIVDGKIEIVPNSYSVTSSAGNYPVWKILTAPFEVFTTGDAPTVVVIMLFILLVGGSFTVMEHAGLVNAVIAKIALAMGNRKPLLVAVLSLFFMLLGSLFGIMEEIVPMVPLVISLCYMLGWDSLMGLGLTLLSACFGFAAAIFNPFTIGVAQSLADLPQFSGAGLRVFFFICIYGLLLGFLLRHAKRIEKDPTCSPVYTEDLTRRKHYTLTKDQIKQAAIYNQPALIFALVCFIVIFIFLFFAPFIGASDFSIPIIALVFILASTISSTLSGVSIKATASSFFAGVSGIAPGILLIPLAMSVKFIISDSGIMDSLLYYASNIFSHNAFIDIVIIFAIVMVMNFFIGSASAKAFLLIPLLVPLADITGISRQSTVLAFSMGDGFSNVIYPTNPMLLIALGLTVVSYPKWFKWTLPLQVCAALVGILFLMISTKIGY
jgi:uncharacterized ion transporter superfamily protein YfcC